MSGANGMGSSWRVGGVEGRRGGPGRMRILNDSTGIQWTVFEVTRAAENDRWSFVPEEFGDGWLCFESRFAKRRLTPVPPRWRDFGEEELERMLERAVPVKAPRDRPEFRDDGDFPVSG